MIIPPTVWATIAHQIVPVRLDSQARYNPITPAPTIRPATLPCSTQPFVLTSRDKP